MSAIINNFECLICQKEFYVQRFTSVLNSEGEYVYKVFREKTRLTCDCGSSNLVYIYPNTEGEVTLPNFQKFGSKTPLQKQEILKKRSKDDNKKQGYVKNYNEIERDERRKFR